MDEERGRAASAEQSWTWWRVLSRAREVLRDEGLRVLAFRILGEIVYRRVILVERRLHEPIPEHAARVSVAIAPLREPEVDEYLALRPDADPAEIRRRLAGGERCFVARCGGRIVHAIWATTGRGLIEYLGREVLLSPDEVYVHQSFTAQDCRGRGIASARVSWMLRFLRDAGYRRVLAVHVPENRAAWVPFSRGGYHPVEVLGYLRLGPWRHEFRRPFRGPCCDAGLSPDAPAYWDAVVERLAHDGHYLDSFLGELKRRAYLALIQRWGDSPTPGPVLKTDLFEEAMGPDALLGDLAHGGGSRPVVGIDVSPAVAGRATRLDPGRRAQYVVADVRALPFAADVFALVVSPSTLDHFPDPGDLGRSLRELHRVLRSDGKLIVTLDNRQNLFDPMLRLLKRFGKTPYYLGRSYTVAELRSELEAVGFAVRETTAILHNPRLMAVASVAVARRLRWPPVTALVQRVLTAAQRLEATPWRYRSGSFVAALAVRQVAAGPPARESRRGGF